MLGSVNKNIRRYTLGSNRGGKEYEMERNSREVEERSRTLVEKKKFVEMGVGGVVRIKGKISTEVGISKASYTN